MQDRSASHRNPFRSGRREEVHRLELNGDSPLTRMQRLKYLAYNSLRNLTGSFCTLRSLWFRTPILERGKGSPSRKILNQFLSAVVTEVPTRRIRVLDIGCGSGYFVNVLEKEGFSGEYTGIVLPQFKPEKRILKIRWLSDSIGEAV